MREVQDLDIANQAKSQASKLWYTKKREKELQAEPDTIDIICAHVGDGGTLTNLCEKVWKVSYGRMAQWINSDETRRRLFSDAMQSRVNWERERILEELRHLSFFDIRQILDENSCVKPPSEWPDEISKAVESMTVNELFQGTGDDRELVGLVKNIKLTPKLKALELIGKTSAMFIERVEATIKPMTLGQMVEDSWTAELPPARDVSPNKSDTPPRTE